MSLECLSSIYYILFMWSVLKPLQVGKSIKELGEWSGNIKGSERKLKDLATSLGGYNLTRVKRFWSHSYSSLGFLTVMTAF